MRTLPGDVTVFTLSQPRSRWATSRKLDTDEAAGDDLGNQDLFRQYYRDKEMSEDDDPFLLIRGRFVGRKGLLPPTSAQAVMRFPCLCWLMTAWRYLYPFWQKTGTQRRTFWLCIEKRNSKASSLKFVYHPINVLVNFLSAMFDLFRHVAQIVANERCNNVASFHIVLPTFLYNIIHKQHFGKPQSTCTHTNNPIPDLPVSMSFSLPPSLFSHASSMASIACW